MTQTRGKGSFAACAALFIRLRWLLASLALLATIAFAQEPANPLKPIDRSSLRAAIVYPP